MQVVAPVSGTSRDVGDVPDPVFASGMVGPGLAIDPVATAQTAVAPVTGRLAKLHPHAYLVVTDEGVGVLVHLGIDTVTMRGDGFSLLAAEDARVVAGEAVVAWDPAYVAGTGRAPMCAVVVLDVPARAALAHPPGSQVTAGEPVFDIVC
jgi:PTS system N-acetylglucosamine-specific IIA component